MNLQPNHGMAATSRQAFKVTACIDWMDVVISTSRRTQHHHIQATLLEIAGTKLWVEAIDALSGSAATTFRIRFRDELANDYEALQRTLDRLATFYPFVSAPTINAIEVACDFRHKLQSASETRAMTYRLQTGLLADGNKPRQFDPALGECGANRFMDVPGRRLDPLLNYRIGSKGDDVSWQCYWKRTNGGQPLPPMEWHARVEVTLQGDALLDVGLAKLADIDGYKFTNLARFFRFRTPIDPETQANGDQFKLVAITINRRLKDATPERGLHSFRSLGRRDKLQRLRRESSHLQADSVLQDAIKGALRRLKV